MSPNSKTEPTSKYSAFDAGRFIDDLDDPLYQEIIASDAFVRLKGIRFLGAIDYLFRPNGRSTSRRHTRYQHTLGVAGLALYYAKAFDLPIGQQRLVVSCALLHDIGHAPLSHSTESAFSEILNLNHHKVGELIVTGRAPVGRGLNALLKRHSISPDSVLDIISGNSKHAFSVIFDSPVNIDTIEGISRSYTYIAEEFSKPSRESILDAVIAIGQGRADLIEKKLDSFWRMKGEVYKYLIQSKQSLTADLIVKEYMLKNREKIDRVSYFLNDSSFLKRHPEIRRALANVGKQIPTGKMLDLSYQKRSFIIDSNFHIESFSDLALRYRQKKVAENFVIN